jgi:hypothetical protein
MAAGSRTGFVRARKTPQAWRILKPLLVDNFFGVDIRQANVESGRKATCGTAEHEGVRESAQYPRLQPTAEPRNPWFMEPI